MVLVVDQLVCSNSVCKIAEDGKCVEGLERSRCTFFGHESELKDSVDGREDSQIQEVATRPEGIALETGLSLPAQGVSSLLKRSGSRVIGLIGPNESGKTSLLAGLYDLFQNGMVGRVAFAGSSTLISFEQACHHARAESRRDEPHFFRTNLGLRTNPVDATFYHLDLKVPEEIRPIALLICDRAGEDYTAVTDDVTEAAGLFEIRRADTIAVLVNGKRLVNPEERHETKSMVLSIVQGLTDGGALQGYQQLAIVLTKKDAVEASEHSTRALQDFGRIVSELRQQFGKTFSSIEPFIVAASPKEGEVDRGSGLADLLDYWLRPIVPKLPAANLVVAGRMFERLLCVEVEKP
jgi:hypothetical protein